MRMLPYISLWYMELCLLLLLLLYINTRGAAIRLTLLTMAACEGD